MSPPPKKTVPPLAPAKFSVEPYTKGAHKGKIPKEGSKEWSRQKALWDKEPKLIDFEKEVKILKENKYYRVADLYYKRGIRHKADTRTILEVPMYKGTLLFDYLSSRGPKGRPRKHLFKTLIKKHAKKKNYEIPNNDDLVVHIRLGDIMKGCDKMDKRKKKASHALYKDFYKKFRPRRLKRLGISRVVVVTAMHFGANEKTNKYFYNDVARNRSYRLLRNFEQQTHAAGFPLKIISNENVDADICFMAHSKYFVKSISLFTTLISECLPRGSQVLKPPTPAIRHSYG